MSRTKIYLSYAGGNIKSKDEIERNRGLVANQICLELNKTDFEVVLDKKDLNYKDSIPKFMEILTSGDFIITLISNKYLTESHYCQIEIRDIMHKHANFYPILINDVNKITTEKGKNELIKEAINFINRYVKEHFSEDHISNDKKQKFLECKLTIKEFIDQISDSIILKQDQVKELINKINVDNEEKRRKRKELVFNESNFAVFEYASILEKFDLSLPVTLYQKLNLTEWNLISKELRKNNNNLGLNIEGSILSPNEQVIKLNKDGGEKSQLYESQDELIFKILVNCNSTLHQEYELFKSLTLKQKYIDTIFRDFSYSLESLIVDSNHLYPQTKKQTLLYRLLAIHYSKKGNLGLMRKAFEKCADLLKQDDENELSGFFIGWAQKEKENNNYEKSKEIYELVLNLFKKRVNTTARFNLAIYYNKEDNIKKSISFYFEKFDNKFIFKSDIFWTKFSNTTFYFLDKGFTEDAKHLKLTLNCLAEFLRNRKLFNLSSYVFYKIKESIEKNIKFKKDLIYSYLNVDSEKNIVKSLIKSDINKVQKILDELKDSNINKVDYQGLLIDFYYAQNKKSIALNRGLKFIKDNPRLNKNSIYLRVANIYFNDSSLGRIRFYKAKLNYNKINPYILETNYMYAISLLNTGEKKKAIKIFKNYFNKVNENNTLAISNYIRCCIRLKKINEASKFIIQKLLNRRIEGYTNSFLSFLYQQQLKLTINKSYSEILLNEALKYTDTDEQKSIVYCRYAEHLISTMHFQNNVFNKPFIYNEIELEEAIINFKKSFDYSVKKDEKILLSIAECYFLMNDYEQSISFLGRINFDYLQEKSNLLRIQIYFKQKKFKPIKKFLHNESRKVKIFSHLCIGKSFKEYGDERKKHLKKAVELDNTYYSKLQQAIVLFSIDDKKKSLEILDEILFSNNPHKSEIKEEFERNVSKYKSSLSKYQKYNIYRYLKKISFEDEKLLKKINELVSKFPFNEQVYSYKFYYNYKLKDFKKCEEVLNIIISKKLFHNKTSNLFYELAKTYYLKSNSRTPKDLNIYENLKYIEKAEYYLGYALDDLFSKFKIKKLSAMIAYKKGDLKTHQSILKRLKSSITDNQVYQLDSYIKNEQKNIKIFLWSEFKSDYFTKIHFYNFQVNTVAATIIGDNDQKDKSFAIKTLKTIFVDYEFHINNHYNLFVNIETRLAHYYFYIKKNYKTALYYQKKIWRKKIFDLNFIGSFLRCITKLKEYDFGIKCCKVIIKRNNSSLVSRFYGNFLKEKNNYKEALNSYKIAFELALELPEINQEEISQKRRESDIILNNIALLVIKTIKDKDLFMTKTELLNLGLNSINKIHKMDPTLIYIKHEYIETTTKDLLKLKNDK